MPECRERDKQSPDYCNDYRKCIGKEFYTYADLKFCPYQVLWIMQHADILDEGRWPDPPVYLDIDNDAKKRQIIPEAYFVKSILTIAIVRMRLELITKDDRRQLWKAVGEGQEFNEIEGGAKSALLYISGWRMRKTPYTRWKAKKNYRYRNRRTRIEIRAIK